MIVLVRREGHGHSGLEAVAPVVVLFTIRELLFGWCCACSNTRSKVGINLQPMTTNIA